MTVQSPAMRFFLAVGCVLLPAVAMAQPAAVFRKVGFQMPDQPHLTAFTMLVPEGWEVKGGIQRTPAELRNMYTLTDVEVRGPDGRSIHFYPAMNFNYNDFAQAQPMSAVGGAFWLAPPQSIGQWILYMNQLNPDPTVTDLRLVSEEPMHEWTQALQRMHAAQIQEVARMQPPNPGDRTFMTVGGTKLVFSFKHNGRPMEETFLVGWRVMGTTMNGRLAMCNWGINEMRSICGPAGTDYMNDPALITIAHSLRFNPRYFEAMHQYYTRVFNRPPAKPVQAAVAETESINDILHDGWKKRSGMTDAGQARQVDTIHERAPYVNPHGETVHLSAHYNRVFSDGDRYILTNNANWNPNIDPNYNSASWTQLERKPYE